MRWSMDSETSSRGGNSAATCTCLLILTTSFFVQPVSDRDLAAQHHTSEAQNPSVYMSTRQTSNLSSSSRVCSSIDIFSLGIPSLYPSIGLHEPLSEVCVKQSKPSRFFRLDDTTAGNLPPTLPTWTIGQRSDEITTLALLLGIVHCSP